MKEVLGWIFKGAAMGAANVIPGVSGGTVAFITGIYQRLIGAVKSIDSSALKLLLRGQFRAFCEAVDFAFLFWIGVGVIVSILTLARVLEWLFEKHTTEIWALFFGLILASIYFVGRRVSRWSWQAILAIALGTGIAVAITLMTPASENDSLWYLLICGVVAMASMIVPGLSGSFVLLLLGNYQLVMIESVSRLSSGDFSSLRILIPVGIGAGLGLIALSRLLSWVFKSFHDQAVALLTGFVAGSLLIIWPWKTARVSSFEFEGKIKEKVVGYDWFWPDASIETLVCVCLIIVGAGLVWVMERTGVTEQEVSLDEAESD